MSDYYAPIITIDESDDYDGIVWQAFCETCSWSSVAYHAVDYDGHTDPADYAYGEAVIDGHNHTHED